MRPTNPYLELIRPLNVVIAALSVFVGALVSSPLRWDFRVLLACLVAA